MAETGEVVSEHVSCVYVSSIYAEDQFPNGKEPKTAIRCSKVRIWVTGDSVTVLSPSLFRLGHQIPKSLSPRGKPLPTVTDFYLVFYPFVS